MNRHQTAAVTAVFIVTAVASLAFAQDKVQTMKMPEMGVFTPDSIHWGAAPPAFPTGAKFALLEGDPAKKEAYTIRVKMPDGYIVPSHFYTGREHITVISGVLHFGAGKKFDREKTQILPAGAFGFVAPHTSVYFWTEGETITQIHGTGPFAVSYINKADDPRTTAR